MRTRFASTAAAPAKTGAVPAVPEVRLRRANDRPVRRDGAFVLYWMIAARRRRANFALQRAVELATQLGRPLFVLEPLRCDHRWASDRLHTFVLQGMADNAADFAAAGVRYWPYVEPEPGAGSGLLEALGRRACAVVTDDFPCFFLPRMVAAAAAKLAVRLEVVDGNGLLPMRVGDKVFARAFDFRRFLQKVLPAHLRDLPAGEPLRGFVQPMAEVPRDVAKRWPMATPAWLEASPAALAALPIDHTVGAVPTRGGAAAAGAALRTFLSGRLRDYGERRSHPDADCASGLSPYLHFGHLSAHQVFAALAKHEQWTPTRIRPAANGQRGWLGMSDAAEAFVDEFVTWRELGTNYCSQRDDYADYESLPAWAKATLEAHATDPREHVYSLEQFAASATHDPVWNAAQRQLRETGTMQNYLRMLWGKKVLEWARSPQQAMLILIELNNRYALDGRDPNSYAGISWVFGRYDRPWAPERDVYGVVRYMSSANTVKKLQMKGYLRRWA
ncbi:MAG TPA: deoxyribodipyrimidine photolyase [Planctomycetota bacterium]|nr:deoxyribodipyrimidine photolyase [Planctomycetota bacterium]